jgi:rhodanese-related sulfurtransferase
MEKSLDDFVAEALAVVPELTPDQVNQRLAAGYLLLDVREPEEFEAGRLPGAINIPRGMVEVRADREHHKKDERLQDRSQRIICYCGGGYRSALAAKALKEMGFGEVYSMAGGWRGWTERGLPTEE